jgi:hypothetical protein
VKISIFVAQRTSASANRAVYPSMQDFATHEKPLKKGLFRNAHQRASLKEKTEKACL